MDSNLLNNKYTVLVAGDVDLTLYDLSKPVTPYVVYEYNNRKNIRKQAINIYDELIRKIESNKVNELVCQMMRVKLQEMQEMTDEEYFEMTTQGMTYDEKTGDALTTINPKGRFLSLTEPTLNTAVPLCGKKFQCKVGDLKEKNISQTAIDEYSKQWDKLMNDSLLRDNYINLYGDKDTYIATMTEPLFYNAFVSNETGWLEQGDENQVQWVLNFRERFINNLSKDTLLRVYNFTK